MSNDKLNDDIFNFPCEFPIKAMGITSSTLETTVFNIVKQHAPDINKKNIKSRPSSNSKYTAITITITARNRKQIDSIYLDLTACKDIIMSL